jgi:hypothetical protein
MGAERGLVEGPFLTSSSPPLDFKVSGCVWHSSGSGCDDSGCGCAGGVDSSVELDPF